MMQFCPLFSGSSGNALFVRYGTTSLLIDAGMSGKTICAALQSIRVNPAELTGILITHEHDDHIRGAGVMSRKFHLPIYATQGTWQGMSRKVGEIKPENRIVIDHDTDFYIGSMGVIPYPISHDAMDPVGYRLHGGGNSVSVATDLGVFTKSVESAIRGSSLVLLESNHDPEMLKMNPHYSVALKKRILGNKGHLSNDSCAQALVRLVAGGTKHIVLGHLSGENNTPDLARLVSCHRAEREGILPERDITLDVALRDRVGTVYRLGE